MHRTSTISLAVTMAILTGCTAVENLSAQISEQMRVAEQNRQQSQMEVARKRCFTDGHEPGTADFLTCVQKELADLSATRPAVSGAGADSAGCTLYEHAHYSGMTHRLRPNTVVSTLHGFNDKASSVRVTGNCTLELYEHDDHRGERHILSQDTAELGRAWNDRASSAKCLCR